MVETLITSSVLILGIILLRFLLRGRISPQLQYGIWGLAALRLVMPWFYPVLGWMGNMTSPFSVMNAAETIREQAVSRPDLGPLVHNLSSGQVTHYTAPATMAQRAAGIDWQMIILILWGAGGILLFIWMLWINLRFSWRIYRSRERYDGDTYGATALPVYWVEGLATPCFMSYLGDRAIYLPKGMEGDEKRMRHVLVHEDCHARRRDHIWGGLRCVLLCCYWINPLVWAAAFLSKRDCELSCDADAVRRLGEEERFSYGRTLIDLTVKHRAVSGFLNISSDMWNGKKAVKERISILAKHPKTTGIMAVLIVSALSWLAVCTYTGRQQEDGIRIRAEQWARAFCDRDGKALYGMYDPERPEGFYGMEPVMSLPEDPYISFGWSSPWPMDHVFQIHNQDNQSVITYYAMTSDPHRWVWKERITWKKTDGVWYVDQSHLTQYETIHSAAEFYEAYSGGIAGTAMDYRREGMAETLNRNARTDMVYQDLLSPGLSMEMLLNLQGGEAAVVKDGEMTVAVYTFPDKSQAAVSMIQPFGAEGIWIPEEIREAPEVMDEGLKPEDGGADGTEAKSITAEDVIRLAGIRDTEDLAARTADFPEPNDRDDKEQGDYLDWFESYMFYYKGELYSLTISYRREDDSLEDIILVRQPTSEMLNIYRTPEDVKHYRMTLPDEEGIRRFLDTHTAMTDYLTYRLPRGLSNQGYTEALSSTGGNVFAASDPEDIKRLDQLASHIDYDFAPHSWWAAGAVERYSGGWPNRRFSQGELADIGLPWNHSMFITEPVRVIDCEAPALLVLVQHDLYTAASLEDVEAEYGPVPEEDQTSRMWYVFFAKPDSSEVYSISLNADLYEDTDVLKLARSVYFTDKAWTVK